MSSNEYSGRLRRSANTANNSNSNNTNNASSSSRSSSHANSNSSTQSSSQNGASSNRPVRTTRTKNTKTIIESDNSEHSDEDSKVKQQAAIKAMSSKQTASATASNTNHTFKIDIDRLAKLESITGLSRAEATQLLEASGNKLEVAVDLHFNSGGSKKTHSSASSSSASAVKVNGASNKRALVNDDVASDSNSNASGEDYVRAPIPQRSEKLLDYDPYAMAVEPQNKKQRTVFDGFRNLQEEYNESALDSNSSHSRKKQSLASLYRPPIDIIFKGTFEASKVEGCRNGKWVLLNVQNQTDFACQCLNRDLWRDDTVKEILKANFVFVQIYFDTVEGKKLIHYYNIATYPFIAIIDPRTGEKLTQFNNASKMDQCMFCEKVTNFLGENELEAEHFESATTSSSTNEVVTIDDESSRSSTEKEVKCIGENKKVVIPETNKPKKAGDILSSFLTNGKTNGNSSKTSEKDEDVYCTEDNDDEEKRPANNSKKPMTNGFAKNITKKRESSSSSESSEENDVYTRKDSKKTAIAAKKVDVAETIKPVESQSKSQISEVASVNHQPKIVRYETPDSETKDCVVRILYPNGDRLDFCTNGNTKFRLLIDYLSKDGFKATCYELIERLMPTLKPPVSVASSPTMSQKISADLSNLAINQSRNLLFFDNAMFTFKELNLFPRVFLLLQEI